MKRIVVNIERTIWVKLLKVAILGLVMSLGSCSKESAPAPQPPVTPVEIGKAKAWLTTGDKGKLLNEESAISITAQSSTTLPIITINPTQTYQQIDGYGAALTGSSAYLLKSLGASQRNTILQELFDPESGIGINYLRVTMGASDFSLSDYTYNDMPDGETDFDLSEFSISPDADVIAILKQVVNINPNIKIMATPWSAPAWMKTNGSLVYLAGKTNKLKTECYEVYAQYFVKYIKAYAAEGITIDAITPQNEPLYYTAGYPSMNMEASEQRDFIKNYLGPLLAEEGLDTKIIVYDHNWDNTDYAISILNDTEASQYIAGSAFHAYAGNVTAMSVVHQAHPDKGLYFTEISGGEWATDFSSNLQWNMQNIFIGTANNWSKNALLWNLALDNNHGPQNGGCSDCRGVITINGSSISRNVEYYSIGHFSKFVRLGAHRIQSTLTSIMADVIYVTYQNTDGTNVLVVSNNSSESKSFVVREGTASQFLYTLPARSVVTLEWKL